MKRLAVVAVLLLASFILASAAVAAIYAGPRQWYAGQTASTGFSPSWVRNAFGTYGSGYDKTVTFIDNKSYSWHNTVRNTSGWTETYAPYSPFFQITDKGHCKANVGSFWGSCNIY